MRLEQRCRFEGGPGGAEDAALLHFWVQELDEFWEAEAAFMGEMRCGTPLKCKMLAGEASAVEICVEVHTIFFFWLYSEVCFL